MAKITVWSKQHENVWKVLQETGRYTVKREYIIKDLKEHSELVLDTYEWLVKNGPDYGNKPADVEFPVWVSFRQDATMLPEKGRVILELEIEESLITRVNFTKWGMILNYSYIPAERASGSLWSQRHAGVYVAVLSGDQTGDPGELEEAF